MNVDMIQEGARDFSLVLPDLLGGASAGLMRIAVIAAWTGIHGRDQHEPGRISSGGGGSCDGHLTLFQRLSQGLQGIFLELRKLIQKENAMVGEADLSRFRGVPSTDQAGVGYRMMGRTEGPLSHQSPFFVQQAGHGVYLCRLNRLFKRDFRQNRRHPLGKHGLPGAGRTDHEHNISYLINHTLNMADRVIPEKLDSLTSLPPSFNQGTIGRYKMKESPFKSSNLVSENYSDDQPQYKPTREEAIQERLADEADRKKTFYDRLAELCKEEIECGEGDPEWIINDIYKAIQKLAFDFEAEHHDKLKEPKKWYPRKWMLNDNTISALLERYRISDVLNAIDKYVRAHGTGIEQRYKGKYEYAAFVTDADFYERMKPMVKLETITLKKYIAALCKVGALILLERIGKNSKPIYASGYDSDFVSHGKPKYNRFLSAKNKEGLKKFVPSF